jgi:hypothetical protein
MTDGKENGIWYLSPGSPWLRNEYRQRARLRGSCHKLSPTSGGREDWKENDIPEPWIALVED